jgi:hypothetical protein
MKSILSKLSFITLSVGFVFCTSFMAQAYPLVPNPQIATGHLCNRQNPDYGGDRYKEKIPYCLRNVDDSLKSHLYDLYKVPVNCRGRYTIDHIIPLSIGGDNSPQNLWPEHKKVKATRPYLEEQVFTEVSEGSMLQKDAIAIILKEKTTPRPPTPGSSPCDQ